MGEIPRQARPYQTEIVLKARKENTIVCLGTGTGKTFISAMVIKELQGGIQGTYASGGKRTFFVVCTVPLASQQAEEIRKVSCLKVASYTGEMEVDFWDRDRWIEEFDKNEVLVMTAQILLDILLSGYIGFHNINLLVFDECHNANKKHPYVKILGFHDSCPSHPHHDSGCTCPRILGLTASVINTKISGNGNLKETLERKMEKMEAKMRARCITCQDSNATSAYAAKPQEIIRTFQKEIVDIQPTANEKEIEKINRKLHEKLISEYDRFKDEYKIHKARALDSIALGLQQSLHTNVVYGNSMLKDSDILLMASDVMKHCATTMEKLGSLSTYNIANLLFRKLNNYRKKTLTEQSRATFQEALSNLMEVVNTYENYFNRNTSFLDISSISITEPFISNRVSTLLVDILHAEHVQFTASDSELHAIVFVKRRCTAVLLSNLLNDKAKQDEETFGWLKSDYVLGHAADESINVADSLMKSSNQTEVLERFKSGLFNVLVSTSVVEEGLDVRKCNLVIRFSGIGTFRQYTQSKGRARSMNSKFIIMCSETKEMKTGAELRQMQELETVLLSMCREARITPTWKETEASMFDEEKDYIPTYYLSDTPDSARITSGNCVALLHRYCNRFLSGENVFSRHNYLYERDDDEMETRATVYLPQDIPLETKTVTGYWMPTLTVNKRKRKRDEANFKYLAKKSVCEIVCIMLHTAGHIDERTVEILTAEQYEDSDDDSDVEEEDEELIERMNEMTVENTEYPRKVPSCLVEKKPGNYRLFAISMILSQPRDCDMELLELWYSERKGFGILLPTKVQTDVPEIDVYTIAGGVSVKLIPLNCTLDDIPLAYNQFHQKITELLALDFVNEELLFDFDNPKVLKGILVPLKQEVCSAIDCGKIRGLDTSVEGLIDQDVLNILKDLNTIGEHSVIQKTYLSEAENRKVYYVTGISDKKAGDVMDRDETFAQYYQRKYQRHVHDSSRLLGVIPITTKVSYTDEKTESMKTRRREDLVGELCKKMPCVDSFLHMQMLVLPYFLYRFECILSAQELLHSIALEMMISQEEETEFPVSRNTDSLEDFLRSSKEIDSRTKSPSVMRILESLTTKQARFEFDLERLEMLGDSFLKQAVTIYLYFRHPHAKEEKLNNKRISSIENRNLFRIGRKRCIETVMCNSQFGNKNQNNKILNALTVWLPPGYSRVRKENDPSYQEGPYQDIRDKSLADCIEALIGLYFMTGGVNLALLFMQNYLKINVFFSSIPDEYQKLFICNVRSNYADFPVANSAPAADQQDVDEVYKELRLSRLETIIGYEFTSKSFLIQAVTHSSYRATDGLLTECYERLEFLGDAILDFLIVLYVFTNDSTLDPGDLSSIKSALVNNNTLALMMVKLGIEKFIRHISPVTDSMVKSFKAVTKPENVSFEQCFVNPFIIVPPGSVEGYQAPKVLGDVFEAIIGAVFLDCGMHLDSVWKVIFPLMREIIDGYMKDVPRNPVTMFTEKYPLPSGSFSFKLVDGDTTECTAHFGNSAVVGRGENKKMAKAAAAWKAVYGK